jgi:hypothetical protein
MLADPLFLLDSNRYMAPELKDPYVVQVVGPLERLRLCRLHTDTLATEQSQQDSLSLAGSA